MAICERLGLPPSNIIAEQGPFSVLSNRAHIERTGAVFLVTKDGGSSGGVAEKLDAAAMCGAVVLMIRRPGTDKAAKYGETGTVGDAGRWARKLIGIIEMPPTTAAGEPAGFGPPLFPMFVSLNGRGVLVVGGGNVAFRKAGALLRCGARLRVASPSVDAGFETMGGVGLIEVTQRAYSADDMTAPLSDGTPITIVLAATNDRDVNAEVARDAAALGIQVNVADSPGDCTFYFPSFVEYDGFVAGISSSGRSPSKCRRLADRLRGLWRGRVEDVQNDAR
jgi:siroheme synthase-like protein